MANTKITNQAGGPYEMVRIRVNVGVAYGSDIDKVRELLFESARECDLLAKDPPPSVRFREFADSALNFQVRGWVTEPALYGRAVDQINTDIYKRFAQAGVEIPFPQRVVHLQKD